MGIVDKINYLKARDNMTSDEVAQRSGVPIGTLNKILSGETQNPTGKTASKIARVFGETAEYLLNDDIAITADSADRFTQISNTEIEENLYKKFGIRLSQIRKEANMTQAEVAQRLGTVQSTYSGYELGTRKITLELLLQLSDIFGVSPTYLAAGINDPGIKVLNPQKDVLNRNYDNLNAEGRKKLVDYSDDLVSGGRYMLTAAHGGGVKKVPAPDPSKDKEIERLTREAMLNSLEDDEEF